MTSVNYMELCRLCLVKDKVSIPIFEDDEDSGQILLKIKSCLPIKVAQDDKLPKKICSDCMLKLDNTYQFHKTTTNAEKQLLQWLSETPEVNNIAPSNTIETEQLVLKEEAIELGDQGSDLAKGLCRVETNLGDKLERTASKDEEETESDEDHTNTDDSGDDGLGKEEADSEDEPYEPLEPTTFVNVSIACDEAGPSGIQPTAEAQGEQPPSEFQAPSTSSAAPETGSGWLKHRIEEHGITKSENYNTFSDVSSLDNLGEEHECQMCGRLFRTRTLLKRHEAKNCEGPYTCSICNGTFLGSEQINQHKKIHCTDTEKVNKCKTCGKIFAHRNSLAVHTKSHKGANMCICDICGKSLTNKEHLKFHRRIHTGEKPYECDNCGKAFSKRCNLKLHMRTHTGERPYACETCGKAFTQRSTLVIHERYHSGERPYWCQICGRGFVCKALLNSHQKSLHLKILKIEEPSS